jgi:hypothetical protein
MSEYEFGKMGGVTFGFYARNGVLGSAWAKDQVDKMVETGVTWVVLTPTIMQETAHTTRQYWSAAGVVSAG